MALNVQILTSLHCDVTIVNLFDSPFDCDITMKKSANRCNVGPFVKGQLSLILRVDLIYLCPISAFKREEFVCLKKLENLFDL